MINQSPVVKQIKRSLMIKMNTSTYISTVKKKYLK